MEFTSSVPTFFTSHYHHTTSSMPSIIAALRLRALIKEIFGSPELLQTASRRDILAAVEDVAQTNPYYARMFMSEYIKRIEEEDAEAEEATEEKPGEFRETRDERDPESIEYPTDDPVQGSKLEICGIHEHKVGDEHDEHNKLEADPHIQPLKELLDSPSRLLLPSRLSLLVLLSSPVCYLSMAANTPSVEPQFSENDNGPSVDPYELLCSTLSAKPLAPSDPDRLRFLVDSSTWVTIHETPRVISGQGTTGARTWNAALLLALAVNTNPRFQNMFRDCTVLELGAGTGLVLLALAKKKNIHGFKKLLVTDGAAEVVQKLPSTFANNSADDDVEFVQFIWGEEAPRADIVMGADIVYDPSVLEILANCLNTFFANGTKLAVIARSERNPETTKMWEAICQQQFEREVVMVEDPEKLELPCWFDKGKQIVVEILRRKALLK